MPPEEMWAEYFNTDLIPEQMEINGTIDSLVEIGCGYGTFTLPVAKIISANLYTFDIDQQMLDYTKSKASRSGIINIEYHFRDIVKEGTNLESNSINYVMLFNILHHENPTELLSEAKRILKPGGKAGIIHWRSDIETPRGPKLTIRPKPEHCIEWAKKEGFLISKDPFYIEPYHYGLIIQKK